MAKYQLDKKIQSVRICRNTQEFLIYFFADDILIFIKANIENCIAFMEILDIYERALC